jgi:hypothetical protein
VNRTFNSVLLLNESDDFGVLSSSFDSTSVIGLHNQTTTIDLVKCFEIKLENLSFHEKLGSGQFGEVFRGSYKKTVILKKTTTTKILYYTFYYCIINFIFIL